MFRKIKVWIAVLGTCCVAFAVSACSDDSSSSGEDFSGPVKIAGLEGPVAQGGPDFIAGMEVAAAEINEKGGIDGKYPIEIVSKKTGGTPTGAASAYQDAARDNKVVGVMIGAAGGLAVVSLAPTVKLPNISASGEIPLNKYSFSDSFGKEYSSPAVAYAVNKLGAKSIASLTYETDFSSKIPEAIQEACDELGCEITAQEESTSTASIDQLTPLLTKMKATNPDAYYLEGLNPNTFKAAQQLGMDDRPIVSEEWLSTPALDVACGTPCEDVVFSAHKSRLSDLGQLNADDPIAKLSKDYIASFEKELPGTPYAVFSTYGRDAVYIYATAIEKLLKDGEEVTRDSIATAMENFEKGDLVTTNGTVESSPTNHRLTGDYGEAHADMVIKFVGDEPTWELAPEADKEGSTTAGQ